MSNLSDILDTLRNSEPENTKRWFSVPQGVDIKLTLNPFQIKQLVLHLKTWLSCYEKYEVSEMKRALEEILDMIERGLKR